MAKIGWTCIEKTRFSPVDGFPVRFCSGPRTSRLQRILDPGKSKPEERQTVCIQDGKGYAKYSDNHVTPADSSVEAGIHTF